MYISMYHYIDLNNMYVDDNENEIEMDEWFLKKFNLMVHLKFRYINTFPSINLMKYNIYIYKIISS